MNLRRGRRAGLLSVEREEAQKMVTAARLLVSGKSQQDIAHELSLSPSSVSRILNRAQSEGIIQMRLNLPRDLNFQEDLGTLLEPKGVRDVIVVPGSVGKNISNLGPLGAQRVLRAITAVSAIKPDDEPIRIALSCGTTVTAVIENLIDLLDDKQNSQNPIKHRLEIYPSTLYGDSELNPVYPVTVVAYFAMLARDRHLRTIMRGTLHEYLITGYAIQLPIEFYRQDGKSRDEYKSFWKISKFEQKVQEEMDIYVVGAGRISDPSYRQIKEQLYIEDELDEFTSEHGEDLLQVLYTPLDKNGGPSQKISKKVVGVTIDIIRNHCRNSSKHVIMVAGGTDKIGPLQTVIRAPCFTTLVTDTSTAREALLRNRTSSDSSTP